jgi:hypothetical protein
MATGRVPTTANSPLTAKGDLFTYSTAPARLAVGNNGETIVANSSTSTGLGWNANYAAGKNKIINGDMNIWQRGTSFTLAGSGVNNYTADRFNAQFDGTGATCTVSQQTFTPGTAPVAGYEAAFFARWNRSAAGSGNTLNYYKQPIEDVRTFAGQTVTLSFWAKADASRTLTAQIYQEFGTGGSGAVNVLSGTASVTTSWQRFTISATIPSISGKTIGTNNSLTLYFIMPTGVAFTFDYWGVQLEAGSVATAFQTATGTLQGELAACQRYYFKSSGGQIGIAQSTVEVYVTVPNVMRAAPTVVTPTSAVILDRYGVGAYTQSTAAVVSSGVYVSPNASGVIYTNFTGLTAGIPYVVRSDGGSVILSSEL